VGAHPVLPPNPSAKIVAQFAWKAALRLVMDELDKIYDDDFEDSDIVKRIKEELGEEE